jgi:iron(III) transport system permease protein
MVTLKHYQTVFEFPEFSEALVNTVFVGFGAATLTMVLSLIVGWVVVRVRMPGVPLLDSLTFLPHAIPGVVIGLALVFFWLGEPFVNLPVYGTLLIVIMGVSTSYLAFGTRTMNSAVAQISKELEDAASTSGANWTQSLTRIVAPLILPALIGGWVWVAAHTLRAFSIPAILSTPGNTVLAVQLWSFWEKGRVGEATAMAVLLIAGLGVITVAGRILVMRANPQAEQ